MTLLSPFTCQVYMRAGAFVSSQAQGLVIATKDRQPTSSSNGYCSFWSSTRISGPSTITDTSRPSNRRALTLATAERKSHKSHHLNKSRILRRVCNPTRRAGMELAGFLSGPPWSASCVWTFRSYDSTVVGSSLCDIWCKSADISRGCFSSFEEPMTETVQGRLAIARLHDASH